VVALTLKFARKRVPVIAGTGSNSTSEAVLLTRFAKEWGADAALLITPYYNRPTQEGLYAHYMAVADAVEIPQVLYNVPARTGVSISPETVARLAEHPNIVAIKEASGSMDYLSQLRSMSNITVLSGNDTQTLPMMALGAAGAIGVLANVAPKHCSEMVEAIAANDWKRAREVHFQTFPLTEALFCETNPIPVKAALAMMGMISPEIRLPLTRLSERNAPRLRRELTELGLLETRKG
jgi:4-hydroxy-tetrahydrodipicolinate synthase